MTVSVRINYEKFTQNFYGKFSVDLAVNLVSI